MRWSALKRRVRMSFTRSLWISMFAGAIYIALERLEYSPYDVWPFNIFISIYPLMVLAALILMLVATAELFSRPRRRRAISRLIFCLTFFSISAASFKIHIAIRESALRRCAERANPLIAAIRNYEQKRGSPPLDLKVLVPEFIGAIPAPGVKVFSEYRYLYGSLPGGDNGDNPWHLWVDTPQVILDFSILYYLPDRKYPPYFRGLRTRRIGDWAYGAD